MEIVYLIIPLIVSIWVYSDAKKRGKSDGSAFVWALGVFLLLIIFLPIWLLSRPRLPEEICAKNPQLCTHCGKYYEGLPLFCPNCGTKI